MPAYSTWQPTEGKIEPIARADQSAARRLVDRRGDLIRSNPIASTLLGVLGGPSDPSLEGIKTAFGESCPAPARSRASNRSSGLDRPQPDGSIRRCFGSVGQQSPCGAIVGLLTRLRNRPDTPFRTNDSSSFAEKVPRTSPRNRHHRQFSPHIHECVPARLASVKSVRFRRNHSDLHRRFWVILVDGFASCWSGRFGECQCGWISELHNNLGYRGVVPSTP
jgi:hypothetical protein